MNSCVPQMIDIVNALTCCCWTPQRPFAPHPPFQSSKCTTSEATQWKLLDQHCYGDIKHYGGKNDRKTFRLSCNYLVFIHISRSVYYCLFLCGVLHILMNVFVDFFGCSARYFISLVNKSACVRLKNGIVNFLLIQYQSERLEAEWFRSSKSCGCARWEPVSCLHGVCTPAVSTTLTCASRHWSTSSGCLWGQAHLL